ncbi:AAA family ATPase [Rhizobium leguminosarum]|uniref:AAA family ATPase n=1 Tax=Rhizobium leguminosarum TaxID=384 RepID=UPI00140F708C|nr:AAA family ATPase [Rhizobium leguminosarum]QIO64807.1 AAA family ATPase [Rhizobium leguminosarum bv. trifolii]
MTDNAEFAAIMEPVARRILGESIGDPNKHLSSRSELRWGKNGSIAVDLGKSTWYDHEDQMGGGVIELLRAFKGLGKGEAIEWLVDNGYLESRENPVAKQHAPVDIPGGFPDFMDPKPIAFYEYFDDAGKLAIQVLKFPKGEGRRFMQRRPHPKGGWVWGLQAGRYGRSKVKKGETANWWKVKEDRKYEAEEDLPDAPRYLYNLAEIRKMKKAGGGTVLLMEGEKDADTVTEWGFVGTTNVGGAKYWEAQFDDELAGLDVVICNDNDDTGRNRIQARAAALRGKAFSVRVLDIAKHWPDCGPKEDITDWKEKGGGTADRLTALIEKAPAWTPTPPKSAFGVMSWNELDQPGQALEYLVHGMLTLGDRSVAAGPSGSGKTFLTLHLAMCVARGIEFLGRPVQQGGVIYQVGEGSRGLKKRLKAYRMHFQVPESEEVPFYLMPSRVDLFSKEGDTQRLIDEINAWKLVMSQPLRLIVIDTFSKATAGADENSGKDVSIIMENVDRIANECGAHVMIVHHLNADGKKLRGHTSLYADVDQVLTVTNDEETKVRTLNLTKQKDDEDGVKINFSLAQVIVGYDDTNERDITSCVVLSVTEKERMKKEQERFGVAVNPTERRFLVEFFEAADKFGTFVVDEPHLPRAARGKTVVSWDHYIELAISKMLHEEDTRKAKDRIRKSFNRMTDGLIKIGALKVERPFMWWTGKPIRGFPRTFPRTAVDPQRQSEIFNETNDPEIDAFRRGEVEVPF